MKSCFVLRLWTPFRIAMSSAATLTAISGGLSEPMSIPPIAIGIVIVVALAWVASLVLIRFRSDDEIEAIINSVRNRDEIEEVVEAELLDPEN